jgi:hypothetical protein
LSESEKVSNREQQEKMEKKVKEEGIFTDYNSYLGGSGYRERGKPISGWDTVGDPANLAPQPKSWAPFIELKSGKIAARQLQDVGGATHQYDQNVYGSNAKEIMIDVFIDDTATQIWSLAFPHKSELELQAIRNKLKSTNPQDQLDQVLLKREAQKNLKSHFSNSHSLSVTFSPGTHADVLNYNPQAQDKLVKFFTPRQ